MSAYVFNVGGKGGCEEAWVSRIRDRERCGVEVLIYASLKKVSRAWFLLRSSGDRRVVIVPTKGLRADYDGHGS